jgi:hypothetical protein
VSRSDTPTSGTRARRPVSSYNTPVAVLLDFVDRFGVLFRPATPLALEFPNQGSNGRI